MPTHDPAAPPAPKRPSRLRVRTVAACLGAAALAAVAGAALFALPMGGFYVGVDNREPDWVSVTGIVGDDTIALSDGRRVRLVHPADPTSVERIGLDGLAHDIEWGEVYADVEPAEGPDALAVRLHATWARCGNSFHSPNPFARVPVYRLRRRLEGRIVGPVSDQ